MKQVLATYLGLHLYVYGIGIVVMLMVVLFLFWRELRRSALQEEKTIDILFASSIIGLIVGRLAYVGLHYIQFSAAWIKIVLPFVYPGVTESAFLIGFLGSLWVYCRKNKLDYLLIVKLLVAPLFVAKLMLLVLSFVTSFALFYIFGFLVMSFGALITYFVLRKAKQNKLPPLLLFHCFIGFEALTIFIIDFFKGDTVYLLGFRLLGVEQLLMLAVFFWITVWAVKNIISSKKTSK
jgi:prolipoprotein diacylglyceryltransferase